MPGWRRPRWQCHQMNGFFQDEDDCTKYYFCQNYEWSHYGCPEGLHFNEERSRCESPETAGCDKRYSSSTQMP
ncbi:hypothetical protein AVEN_226226-1 [Araneus ventricosus]|uniref:Chitin-binding type-2 domain-containing protein n=1 Tax=Araneus ventricosus TaxID=182803 RepID=A0A4Y2J4V7_ARAVE|nr:hypothetical protein AVEN_226226-1 [Araneus ventricosus]